MTPDGDGRPPGGTSALAPENTAGGAWSLAAAFILFALGTPLAKWLADRGEALGFAGAGAVSFCNLFFLGNLVAALVVLARYGPRRLWGPLRDLGFAGHAWVWPASAACVATPTLMFFALDTAPVADTVLLGRVGPLLFALSASVLFHAPLSRWDWAGNGLVLAGVLVIVGWRVTAAGSGLPRGDVLALYAGVAYCVTTILGRGAAKHAGVPSYMLTRNLVSAAVFCGLALHSYGPRHFMDLATPGVWPVVAVYAVVAVSAAQFAWYHGLEHAKPVRVGTLSVLTPLAGVLFGWLLLGEEPTPAQYAALLLSAAGIAVAAAGRRRAHRNKATDDIPPEATVAAK